MSLLLSSRSRASHVCCLAQWDLLAFCFCALLFIVLKLVVVANARHDPALGGPTLIEYMGALLHVFEALDSTASKLTFTIVKILFMLSSIPFFIL